MTIYTRQGKSSDKAIQKYLDIVTADIVEAIPSVKSIILMGGYGKGEGGIIKTKKGYMPVNDFDLYIVTEKLMPDKFLEDLAEKISKKLGWGGKAHAEAFETARYDFKKFLHIDIRCLVKSQLKYLPHTVRYFEMKYASKVLYGEDVLKLFPEIKEDELPISEGLRLIMNRQILLMIAMKPEWVKNPRLMTKQERKILFYYIGKAYFTACENILICNGRFKPTYYGRAIELKKMGGYPELVKKVNLYLKYKETMNDKGLDPIKEWFDVSELLDSLFYYGISKLTTKENIEMPYFEPYAKFFLKKYKIDNWLFRKLLARAAMTFFSYKFSLRMHEAYNTPKLKYLSIHDPGVKILMIAPPLMRALNRDGKQNYFLLDEINKELKKIFVFDDTKKDWESTKTNYLFAQRTYFLMRFV